jgi:integrase
MSIHPTSNGRFRVRFYESGQPNPRSRTFDTRREAKDFEAALRVAKRTNRHVRRASTETLERFGAEYRDRYALVELAPSTLKVQASLWNGHVLPKLGGVPLATLAHSPEVLQQFKADLIANGVGDGAVGKTLAILSAVLNKAVEWNRIPSNPAATIRKPPAKRKRIIEPIPPEQIERLRANTMSLDGETGELAPTASSALITLIAYGGLRPGEALALTWADIGERSISITKALALGETRDTKTRKDRTVPLPSPLRDDLLELEPLSDSEIVLGHTWSDHDWRNWRRRVWQPACVKIGMAKLTTGPPRSYAGPRPYDLRHSAASLMLAAGLNPLEVADAMGHGPQILFNTYAHVIAELRGQPSVPVEQRIRDARSKLEPERRKRADAIEYADIARELHARKDP